MERLKFDRLEPGMQPEGRRVFMVVAVKSGIILLTVLYVNRSDREILIETHGHLSVCTADQFDHRGYEIVERVTAEEESKP